jgi:hypothetical protein
MVFHEVDRLCVPLLGCAQVPNRLFFNTNVLIRQPKNVYQSREVVPGMFKLDQLLLCKLD